MDDHDHGRTRHRRRHHHLVAETLVAALIGLGLGAITGLPIGVVNVAIVDAATRGERRFATGIGIGGALADGAHAALAFIGVGQLIAEHPQWSRVLAIAAACIILVYVAFGRRARPAVATRRHASGVVSGVLLTLPNPAALGAWVTVAALGPPVGLPAAIALAIGVTIGSGAWFVTLARWVSSLPADGRIARTLPRIGLALLVVLACIGIARAFVPYV